MALWENDAEIIELCKKGEANLFKILVDRYTSPLFNFAARLVGPENAPDILQEVFLKAWKNLKKFDSKKASFKTWIFTIARNSCTDFSRKKKQILFSEMEDKEAEESFEESIPDEVLLQDEIFQKMEDEKLLGSALEKLLPEYRSILILHYAEDMTFDEIGKILKKPPNTVKSRHYRAILSLRKILSRQMHQIAE